MGGELNVFFVIGESRIKAKIDYHNNAKKTMYIWRIRKSKYSDAYY